MLEATARVAGLERVPGEPDEVFRERIRAVVEWPRKYTYDPSTLVVKVNGETLPAARSGQAGIFGYTIGKAEALPDGYLNVTITKAEQGTRPVGLENLLSCDPNASATITVAQRDGATAARAPGDWIRMASPLVDEEEEDPEDEIDRFSWLLFQTDPRVIEFVRRVSETTAEIRAADGWEHNERFQTALCIAWDRNEGGWRDECERRGAWMWAKDQGGDV